MSESTKSVRLLVAFAGEWSGNVGDIVSRPTAEAERMIASGYAEPAKAPVRQRATRSARETAAASEAEEASATE